MTEENNNQNGDEKEMVTKAELDAALARSEKLEKDLEDVRMEVLTPEYQKFLDALEKGGDEDEGKKKSAVSDGLGDDDKFEKMSKKEIFDLAVKAAREEISGTLTKKEQEAKQAADARTKREIASFAKEHEDFETFRPIMYGLSLDPKNADMNLSQLYKAAKDHVKSIHTEPSPEEKRRQARGASEKPGGDSSSLAKLKSMDNESIAREALAEVKAAGLSFDNIE